MEAHAREDGFPGVRFSEVVLSVVLAFCSTASLWSTASLAGDSALGRLQEIFPVHPGQFAVFALLLVAFAWRMEKKKIDRSSFVLACVLGVCVVVGRSMNDNGNLAAVKDGLLAIGSSSVCWIGFSGLFYLVIAIIFEFLDSLSLRCTNTENQTKSNAGYLCSGRQFLKYMLLILACWAPYLIVEFPGNTCFDFLYQLQQYYGAADPTDHHPWFMTLLFGALYQVGYDLTDTSNGGLFAVIFVQFLALSATAGAVVYWIRRMGCPRKGVYLCLAFFALWPLFPLYALWGVKDILSTVLLVNMIMQVLLRFTRLQGRDVRVYASWPAILIVSLLCALSRNNCIFIVVPLLAALLAVSIKRGQTVSALVVLASVLSLYLLWTGVALPLSGVERGGITEALSLPLLQSSKCVSARSDELSDSELAAIQDACIVPVGDLDELYSHRKADEVRSKFSFDDDRLRRYLESYMSMGLKFPEVYAYVALQVNYGYVYPAPPGGYAGLESEITTVTMDLVGLEHRESNSRSMDETLYSLRNAFPDAKAALRSAVLAANNLPILWMVFAPACYIWASATLLVYLFRRRKRGRILLLPLAIIFLICIASPLNGSIRYAFSFAFAAPLLFGCAASAPSCFAKAESLQN